ncbi:MAG TPA: FtsX-like permease family protein [Jatrophihabitans sp.]|nr:FtsX-like permease family protein [Jatrophihabitans sp.]
MGLLVRALWWRRGLSLATLLVAAITIAASCLGPLYARAADESTLRDALRTQAGPASLHFSFVRDIQTEGDLQQVAVAGPQPGTVPGFPRTVLGISIPTGTSVTGQDDGTGPRTLFAWQQDECAHVVMAAGHCPNAPGQVMVSERTVQGSYGWRVGGKLSLTSVLHGNRSGTGTVEDVLTIVGSYRQRDVEDPYWYSHPYFDARPGVGDGPDTVDAIFADKSELGVLAKPSRMTVTVDYPIDPTQIRMGNVAQVRAGLTSLGQLRSDAGQGDGFSTDLDTVLRTAQSQQHLVNVSTLLVSLQLAVLAWLVLFQVIADAAEAKGPEIALAKLRGLAPARTLRFGLAETTLLIALATPLGLLGGWLAVRLFADAVLAQATPVAVTDQTWIAVLAALAGSLVAALAASRRTLRRSVLEQWRRTPGHHPSRWMLALDVVLAVLAVAGLLALHRSAGDQQPHAATLLAPALLVFAVALLGIRLLPLLLRPMLPATRGSSRIGLFLAVRQVVRRPAGLRLAALLTVAVGLATFAIAGEGVATANRQARARLEVGAPRTAPVQFEPAHDPIAATQAVDPDGRWAMATASFLPAGGGSVTGTVLGVDTRRLAAVAYDGRLQLSAAQLAGHLLPPRVPQPLLIKASQVRVTVAASQLTPGVTPTVLFNLRKPGQRFLEVRAGSLRAGTHSYTATVPCADGCTLAGITWDRPIDTFSVLSGTVLVSRLERFADGQWQSIDAGLTSADAWRAGSLAGNTSDRLSITAAGLQDVFSSESGGSAGIAHGDSPSPLPVVLSRNGAATGPDAVRPLNMTDEAGGKADYQVQATVDVLPSVLDQGVLVDLAAIRAQLPAFDTTAKWSIWLGPKAPPDAIQRLTKAGLTIQPGPSAHQRAAELSRQGPALALRLLVVCAIAGSVLAVGGTAIAIAATGRRRSFELASLRALGIRRRTLLSGSITEQLLLLGAALVLGVPSGYLAARLSMPAIPEFADTTPVALRYTPQLLGVLLFTVTFTIILSITSVIAGRALMAAAAPSRLREAE